MVLPGLSFTIGSFTEVIMKRLGILVTITLALAGCGGGGSSTSVPSAQPPTTPTAAPTAAPFAPTSMALKVSSYTSTPSVDPADAHMHALGSPSAAGLSGQLGKTHIAAVQSGFGMLGRVRRPQYFLNSPSDVSYYGGFVVGGTVSHNIYISTNYINCGTTCWGNPGQFLTDMGNSTFINHLDQYIGISGGVRYTKGTSFTATLNVLSPNPGFRNPVISQSDLMTLVYSAAQQVGGGYGHIFHLFLPPGHDTCGDLSNNCYSPDHFSTFAFCAYHGWVDYGSGKHYLYSVEPYQDVPGCGIVGGPNAAQNGDDPIDSTDSTLSHELFETITDPDVGSGWFNGTTGDEIGDPCRSFLYTANLNGTNYAIQSEYSDVHHACIN
jgi:hypothetical protein